MCHLSAADTSVSEHKAAMRIAVIGLFFGTSNVSEVAAFEHVLRTAQLAKWRHCERMLGSCAHVGLVMDARVYL